MRGRGRAVVLAIVAAMASGRALAQSTDQDPLLRDLQRQMEDLRAQLATLQSRIDELAAVVPGGALTPGTVAEQSQPTRAVEAVTSPRINQATSTYQTVGAEYLLGWYERKDGETGNASRIQVSLKYAFVRVDGDE